MTTNEPSGESKDAPVSHELPHSTPSQESQPHFSHSTPSQEHTQNVVAPESQLENEDTCEDGSGHCGGGRGGEGGESGDGGGGGGSGASGAKETSNASDSTFDSDLALLSSSLSRLSATTDPAGESSAATAVVDIERDR